MPAAAVPSDATGAVPVVAVPDPALAAAVVAAAATPGVVVLLEVVVVLVLPVVLAAAVPPAAVLPLAPPRLASSPCSACVRPPMPP